MLIGMLSIALAAPVSIFEHDPLRAEHITGGARSTAMGNEPLSVGLEGRIDSPLFARVRIEAQRQPTPALRRVVNSLTGQDTELTRWISPTATLDLAWSPLPGLRVGGTLTSQSTFTGNAREQLEAAGIAPQTRGVTRAGPQVAIGLQKGPAALHLVNTVRVPIASRWAGDDRPVATDGSAVPSRALHSVQWDMGVEGRAVIGHVVLGADLALQRTFQSPYFRDVLSGVPGEIHSPRTQTDPRASLSVGYAF